MSQFDLIDLRLFVNIAEASSLTHGAERSFMSVPAASVRLKNLEEQVGSQLFYRTNHGVRLTAAGQAFLHHGKIILRSIENLEDDLHEYAQGAKGHLRVLANPSSMAAFLPAVMGRYMQTHPDVSIDLCERSSHEIASAVAARAADVGVFVGQAKHDDLNVLPYRTQRLFLATAVDHPLAAQSEVTFEGTIPYDYVALTESTSLYTFLRRVAMAAQKRIRVRTQVSNFETLCRMVEVNVGVGILLEAVALQYSKTFAIRAIPFSNGWSVRQVCICTRSDEVLPSFGKDLIDLLMEDAARDQGIPRMAEVELDTA